MLESDFIRIQSKLKNYKYFSMQYTDYSEVEDYQIIVETDPVILLYGFHPEAKSYEYHWATNHPRDVIEAIDKNAQCFITFIPKEWVDTFEQVGFVVRNRWHDYILDSLDNVLSFEGAELLTEADCKEASLVTLSCKGQSRGFTGQTEEWIRSWLNNSEYSDQEMGAFNRVILIERNENKEIVGIMCTGTYAHESQKGAITWIREVAVKPEYQRKGIARKLIAQALAYGKSFGAKRAFLAADECNTYAIHLYQSFGFKASSEESQIDMIRE